MPVSDFSFTWQLPLADECPLRQMDVFLCGQRLDVSLLRVCGLECRMSPVLLHEIGVTLDRQFDTPCLFGRDISKFEHFASTWYGETLPNRTLLVGCQSSQMEYRTKATEWQAPTSSDIFSRIPPFKQQQSPTDPQGFCERFR